MIGSNKSLIQAAQLLLTQNPDVETVYFVGDKFYHTYSDVIEQFPGMVEEDVKWFSSDFGVFDCQLHECVLKEMCESRKTISYVVDDAGKTLTKEELLQNYSLTEPIIEKIFSKDGNVMKCKSNSVLEAFKV